MSGKDKCASVFFGKWLPEFTRAVEMFAGEAPKAELKPTNVPELADEAGTGHLWWKQAIACGDPPSATIGCAWIGAPEKVWRAIGLSFGVEGEEARNTYLEMVQQSLAGAAHVLGGAVQNKFVCGEGGVAQGEPPGDGEAMAVAIEMHGNALPGIFAVVDSVLAIATTMPADPAAQPAGPAIESGASAFKQPSILDRAIDLTIRFSVVLGRATLPIGEVLKLTAGSLIELEHTVNEPVELVVRGAVVAYCEIVQVKGNYGIRIQRIISPQDRMNLKGPIGKAKAGSK